MAHKFALTEDPSNKKLRTLEKNRLERCYSAGSQTGWGWEAWQEMFSEIMESRELIWRLFLRDLTGRYKQSLLGFFWVIVPPLIMVGTFVVINRAGILNVGEMNVPYPVYVLIGTALWQVFTGSLIKREQVGESVLLIQFRSEVFP